MPHRRGFAAVALAALACGFAVAQDLPAVPEPPPPPAEATDPLTDLMRRVNNLEGELKKEKERRVAKAADAGRMPTVNWMMQIQTDAIWSTQDAANREAVGVIPDGAAFRRARFGMYGDLGPWEYRIAMDFALSGRPSFVDVFIGLNDVPYLGRVRVGHFFEPVGLEQYSQNRFVTFLERSLVSDPIQPGRNLGVMANSAVAGERGTWAIGLFRTDSDVYGDDTGNDFQMALSGRVTGLAWYVDDGRDLLHLGLAYSARATRDDQVVLRQRPEIRIGSTAPNIPLFADTGPIAAAFYQLVAAELLWVRGPFSVQAEYTLVPVSTHDLGAVYFQGWYAMGSVFLTGENRAYRRSTGTLDRIHPRKDFVRRDGGCLVWGPGAWELAARVSHLDLNSGGITGGRVTDVTLGVNWYLTPYARMTANYIHAYQRPPTGRPGTADFFGIRAGYEF
jgi:phosphate-selective porin OprO/OprP